ncbi:HAD family phosphatase [Maritimibacter sp. UBA3975]|uniref:HAD family hydrolase n=1 Tax=Maritimibacter sp. UBA3975 TaxID=1946833 RepID=UPI000C0A8382|nr:HAD family phosphatase [Maritimibacter sp. UBA3975]MAM63891.1 hydrolase [Maritimibacter sp.]|tara:strand:- start:44687 stop:45346 length:660 start_codon:yes stop_codon:yes gene_type:complete
MSVGAVLFDCDGVLVDSEPAAFELLREELARHGRPMSLAEAEATFIGGTIAGVAEKARGMGIGFGPDWVEVFYAKLYARLAEGTDLMPGVLTFFDALDRAGIPYAVGSNGTTRKMETTLGQHPEVLDRLKGRLFSGQEIGAPKPAPDLYLMAAQALGVAPEDCVVIEDSATGAQAGVAAGMRVLGYSPNGDGAALAEVGAEVIGSYAQAADLLGLYSAA